MNSDRLRQLADAATPGPWRHQGHRTEGMLVSSSTGTIVIDPFLPNPQDLPLIEAMGGPDAARLLADAMDWLRTYADAEDWHAYCDHTRGERIDPDADALLARFAALGDAA